jgi:hypothetical protein
MWQVVQEFPVLSSISVISALTASSAGIIPRIGPIRAITLAIRSELSISNRSNHPASLRIQDVGRLKEKLTSIRSNEYIIVTGAHGIGKSCVVDTAIRNTCYIRVHVFQANTADHIVQSALKSFTGIRISFWDFQAAAKRILFFHGIFARYPPIVVLDVYERMENRSYAEIPRAVWDLANLGFRVLVDGPTNSIPLEALIAKGANVMDLEPMTQETLESISEFKNVIKKLRKHGLFDVVWAVVGGAPVGFKRLCRKFERAEQNDINIEFVVESYLQEMIVKAIIVIGRACISFPQIEPVLEKFQQVDEIPLEDLLKDKIQRPSPDKVLREKMKSQEIVLVPANCTIAFVLKHNLRECAPSLKELKALICTN